MILFDAAELARAWLAVWTATCTRKEDGPPAITKTLIIEIFPDTIQLWATDQFMLLAATVIRLDGDERVPSLDQLPDRVVIVSDAEGLGRHLLGHVLTLAARIDKDVGYNPGDIEVRVDLDVRVKPDPKADQQIEGLEPTFVLLTVPDVEIVYLPVVETPAPDWRPIVHAFAAEETKHVTLNPEIVERLGRVRRYADGPLVWKFGGADRPAMVDWPASDPHIQGVITPRRDVPEDEPDGGAA